MKRNVCVLFLVTSFMALFSCSNSKGHQASSIYESTETESVKEDEVKEAPKKSEMFYQQLLDDFCQRFYNECFGRTYHSNSLIVDEVNVVQGNWDKNGNIISWNMMVKGKHSFKAKIRNHNDSPFVAFVDDLGNNTYKITFMIKRYGPFGQMDEEEKATRTMSFYD